MAAKKKTNNRETIGGMQMGKYMDTGVWASSVMADMRGHL